jgi:hypothetical protein
MPRGPKGEKRPADVIGAAAMVGRIALSKKFRFRKLEGALKCRSLERRDTHPPAAIGRIFKNLP